MSVVGLLSQNVVPMVSEWNLQVQRQLWTNQSISIAYVGTHGAHLVRNYNANQNLFVTGDKLFPNLGTNHDPGHQWQIGLQRHANTVRTPFDRRLAGNRRIHVVQDDG